MCFIGMQQHWHRPKERDIRKACKHEIPFLEVLKNSKKPHFVQRENFFKDVLLVMCSFS